MYKLDRFCTCTKSGYYNSFCIINNCIIISVLFAITKVPVHRQCQQPKEERIAPKSIHDRSIQVKWDSLHLGYVSPLYTLPTLLILP